MLPGATRPAYLAPHVACPFPGMQLPRPLLATPPSQPFPFTPPTQASVGSAGTPARTPSHSVQAENSGLVPSNLAPAFHNSAATPGTAGAAQPKPSPPSCATARSPAGQEMVPPSADEVQLHSLVSKLRVALDSKEAAVAALNSQLEATQRQLVSCDVERRGLQLQLIEGQQHLQSTPGSPARQRLLEQLRQELGQEVHVAAEARAERDALRLQVAALQSQLEAAAQADAQVKSLWGTTLSSVCVHGWRVLKAWVYSSHG